MTPSLIRKAFWTSFFLVLVFSTSLAIFYFGTVNQTFSTSFSKFIGFIAMISLGLGLAIFIFGFITPVLGGYIFEQLLNDKMRRRVLLFKIWRWLLNK